MKKEYVCIVCPNSCRLLVEKADTEVVVVGHGCLRGIRHGVKEYTNPERMLTTTVVIKNGPLPRLPVISTGEIPKAKMRDCLADLYALCVSAPVKKGDIVAKNIGNTGVDVIASRSVPMA
jgi:CxxC motif-containing protein